MIFEAAAGDRDRELPAELVGRLVVGVLVQGALEEINGLLLEALLLGLLRGLPTFFRAQQKKEFIRRPTRDLHRTTVGIVGLGGNGTRIAEVLISKKYRALVIPAYDYSRTERDIKEKYEQAT